MEKNEWSDLEPYKGKEVVVDTDSKYIYIGVLSEVGPNFIALDDVDVHDHSDSRTTSELYIIEAKKLGIKKNRRQTKVVVNRIVSIGLLDDVLVC